MKPNRNWILLLIVILAASFLYSSAWAAADDQVTIIGTLEKSKRGVFLATNNDKYLIIGQDLSGLVGRKVKVVGKVIENNRGKSLMVAGVEIVRK